EVASALAWCADNKTRFKKSKSKLEFQLRLQEFIELVRANSYKQAILYAQKHLAPWGATHMNGLQHFLATLAFKSTTECTKYKVLFELQPWDALVHQFKQEFCKLYGMTMEPLLSIYLQAGLSALKAPRLYQGGPALTRELPEASFAFTVFPNGYVYSTKALKEMADKSGGEVKCTRTGLICKYTDLVKAYIYIMNLVAHNPHFRLL
uniref:CTLH domain-containing protein n=1 Tax=Brassica oleracea var. oleracea TaxID=109376 RepID=A0A0D3CTY1_BRAOL